MCLVLGCPGAGCSTFLKTIANQRGDYADVVGDVRYAGIDAAEMAKLYKGEVAYNREGIATRPPLALFESDHMSRRYPYIYFDGCSDDGIFSLDQDSRTKWSSPRSV